MKRSHVYFLIFYRQAYYGSCGAQLIEALRYKPEGRGFDSRWCRTVALGLTQPLTEMSTRSISGGGVKAAGA